MPRVGFEPTTSRLGDEVTPVSLPQKYNCHCKMAGPLLPRCGEKRSELRRPLLNHGTRQRSFPMDAGPVPGDLPAAPGPATLPVVRVSGEDASSFSGLERSISDLTSSKNSAEHTDGSDGFGSLRNLGGIRTRCQPGFPDCSTD